MWVLLLRSLVDKSTLKRSHVSVGPVRFWQLYSHHTAQAIPRNSLRLGISARTHSLRTRCHMAVNPVGRLARPETNDLAAHTDTVRLALANL